MRQQHTFLLEVSLSQMSSGPERLVKLLDAADKWLFQTMALFDIKKLCYLKVMATYITHDVFETFGGSAYHSPCLMGG